MFDKMKEKMAGMAGASLDQHMGTIQELVKKEVGPRLQEVVNDNGKMTTVFQNVYTVLPAPVRLMVSQDKFVEFCMAHKDKALPTA